MCIRKYLNYRRECPQCHKGLVEVELRPNKLAVEVLESLTRFMPVLYKTMSEKSGEEEALVRNKEPNLVKLADKLIKTPPAEKVLKCSVCSVSIPKRNLKTHEEQCKKGSLAKDLINYLFHLIVALLRSGKAASSEIRVHFLVLVHLQQRHGAKIQASLPHH